MISYNLDLGIMILILIVAIDSAGIIFVSMLGLVWDQDKVGNTLELVFRGVCLLMLAIPIFV